RLRFHLAWGVVCLAAFVSVAAFAGQDSTREQALALVKKARRAEKAGHNVDAYVLYSEAAALETANPKYRAKMQLLQSRAALEAKAVPADSGDSDANSEPAVAPEDVYDSLTAREYARDRQPQGPPMLQGAPGIRNFNL